MTLKTTLLVVGAIFGGGVIAAIGLAQAVPPNSPRPACARQTPMNADHCRDVVCADCPAGEARSACKDWCNALYL